MPRPTTRALALSLAALATGCARAAPEDHAEEGRAQAQPPEDPDARFLRDLPRQLVAPRNRRAREASADGVDHHLRVEVGDAEGVPPATIEAWVFDPEGRPARDAVDTVMILHGLGDWKGSMAGLARLLAARGVRVVLPDLRGHGRSTGAHIAYGAFETRDLKAVLDRMALEGLGPGRVAVYGASYGGHVALLLAAADRRVDRVVAVGAYRSLLDEIPHFVRHRYPERAHLPRADVEAAVRRAARLAGFEPSDADAEARLDVGRARVLLVHGTADEVVPFESANALAARCPTRCAVLPFEGKGHLDSMRGMPLRRAIFAWVDGRFDAVPAGGG